MQILSAEQIKAWDNYTTQHEPVAFIDLMERAAQKCVEWIKGKGWREKTFHVFCGKYNNGGDGIAIARLLLKEGYCVSVYILETGKPGSENFETNLQRLNETPSVKIIFLQAETDFPEVNESDVAIDALLGCGLARPLEGLVAQLVKHINGSDATVVSIDLPTGLFIEKSSLGNPVIEADYTLTFECYKLCLLVQENAPFVGEVHVLDIGLHPDFLQQVGDPSLVLDEKDIREIFRPRKRFAHKGSFGHALLVGGSYGKMGAMVMATKACLATGAGLTTAVVPKCGAVILQTMAPEAMAMMDNEEESLSSLPGEMDRFTTIGIGPGMGTKPETQTFFSFIIRRYRKPMVIDADGLNCLAQNKELLTQLPPFSLLTPHPKEFDRLFGEHKNDFERIETAKAKAKELNVVIVLKSHHTLIATPDGQSYFNSTGNAGMAKGGSGDALTGILTALLAQGYHPTEAAQLGVYIHGWAGDVAAELHSKEAMLPTHLIECLSQVFLQLSKAEE